MSLMLTLNLIKRIEKLEKNIGRESTTKLVANDTVVKIKTTEQLPITVDINKICSVRSMIGI